MRFKADIGESNTGLFRLPLTSFTEFSFLDLSWRFDSKP
jgi:hypothetical protein